jgi:hypothetical protein
MLDASEFTIGSLAHAGGLCFVMPRTEREEPFLVSPGNPRTAVYLGGTFRGFSIDGDVAWKGLIIPNIRIEVDPTIAFDPDYGTPAGSIVRHDDKLSIIAAVDAGGWRQPMRVPLVTALSACEGELSAGFRHWQVVVGEGSAKRVLQIIDLAPPSK